MICLTSCDPWRKCVLSYFLYWCFSAGERYLHLQLQGSGVCSPSQKNTTAGRASVWRWWAVKRWVWTEMWALEENATTESCKTDRKKKQREIFFFFKSKIRACGGGRYGRADMIQRGQRDVRYFLKKWTFNDPLGDSVRPSAEDEDGRRCSD